MSLLVNFRPLGIEDCMEKAKEGIGSKGLMKRSQKEETGQLCDRMHASCDRTGPWGHHERASVCLMPPYAKDEISSFRVKAKPFRRPNSTYMKREQLRHKA
ncbi:hypothetical protein PIB30_044191 [Stylosanthes scabra]|uniref:Uncharacterized protein n=1 Tax=Stylosanthes scabra TaxID=79078 RepID=A0ABU6QFR0_9FABA|nr:hypothetical protein [Stylosanthes scabra]